MPIDASREQKITDVTDAAAATVRAAWVAVEAAREAAAKSTDAELPARLAELSDLIAAADAAEYKTVQLTEAAIILKGR